MSEQTIVSKRAIDVTPLNHGIWCRVAGSEPFVNTVVLRKWSEDGTHIVFMLDSHNFLFRQPDEMVDVVETPPLYGDTRLVERVMREDSRVMTARPGGPATCPRCGYPKEAGA